MVKVAVCTLGAVLMFAGGQQAQAQFHHHGGGHFDWHNGHLDWHEPGHFDFHGDHWDYHTGHVDHLLPTWPNHWHHDHYVYPATPTVIAPTIVNPLPGSAVVTGYAPNNAPIAIVNPADYATPVTFSLNGRSYTLQPGEQMDFRFDRAWTIEFHRGGDFGTARYSLCDGIFRFTAGTNGWDIRRVRADANTLPAADPGANALPGLPSGQN